MAHIAVILVKLVSVITISVIFSLVNTGDQSLSYTRQSETTMTESYIAQSADELHFVSGGGGPGTCC